MKLTRVTITIPDELVSAADRRATLERRSRSWVLTEALKEFLKRPPAAHEAELGCEVVHVLGDTIDAVVSAIPLVQPHPSVRIEAPGIDSFVVNEDKTRGAFGDMGLVSGLLPLDLASFDIGSLPVIELDVGGSIADFFEETRACWWIAGTMRGDLHRGTGFGDDWFRARVELGGLGEHDVRIAARNPIGRVGIDWITVTVGLKEPGQAAIDQARRHLGELLTTSASEPRVMAASRALVDAWMAALLDPSVRVRPSWQDPQSFHLTPSDQTRTRVRDAGQPKSVVASVGTTVESHAIDCREERPELYLNESPVRNHWVTEQSYHGSVYGWEKHGVMRGTAGTAVVSQSLDCARATPIFGVETHLPERATVPTIDTPIVVTAVGTPAAGLYRWSVVARPDADAVATISPTGWTAKESVWLSVDTPGRYTLKVEYQLGGRTCSLTYALASVEIGV